MTSDKSNASGGDVAAIERAAKIAAAAPIEDTVKDAYAAEKSAYENAKQKVETDLLAERLENAKQDRKLRERYATYAFGYLVFYTGFCVILVIAQGRPDMSFKLSDSVVITLVGSTAVAAIGLVGWVARGLFKAPD